MANILDTITDALDSSKHGSREVKVWIAEKLDDKTFQVVDESNTISLIVENKMILAKKFCGEDNFVKLIHPSVSQDEKSLILTEKSHMVPLRAKGELKFRGSPAPFVPCYDPKEAKAISAEESGNTFPAKLDQNFGSFEVECNKKPGEVRF